MGTRGWRWTIVCSSVGSLREGKGIDVMVDVLSGFGVLVKG